MTVERLKIFLPFVVVVVLCLIAIKPASFSFLSADRTELAETFMRCARSRKEISPVHDFQFTREMMPIKTSLTAGDNFKP